MPKDKVVRRNTVEGRIRKVVAEQARVREGLSMVADTVEGRLELRPIRKTTTLEELIAGITPENCHGEIDWGADVGKEIIEW